MACVAYVGCSGMMLPFGLGEINSPGSSLHVQFHPLSLLLTLYETLTFLSEDSSSPLCSTRPPRDLSSLSRTPQKLCYLRKSLQAPSTKGTGRGGNTGRASASREEVASKQIPQAAEIWGGFRAMSTVSVVFSCASSTSLASGVWCPMTSASKCL